MLAARNGNFAPGHAWAGAPNGSNNWTGPGMRARFNNSNFNATNMSVPAVQRLAFQQALVEGDYATAQSLASQYPAFAHIMTNANQTQFNTQAARYAQQQAIDSAMKSHDFSKALNLIEQMQNSTKTAGSARGMGIRPGMGGQMGFGSYAAGPSGFNAGRMPGANMGNRFKASPAAGQN